jgi:2-polyprenyl-3-methyl-5-hydroxy-6-metoxy-1,4-benzoquinol methylase
MIASSIDQAKLAEQNWHDSWYQENARAEFPESPADFREIFRRVQLTDFCEGGWSYWGDARNEMMRLCGDVRGLRVLDYGCGSGQLGIYLAMLGAQVTGFDLSPRGVEIANWAAQKYGLTCSFMAMDAEELAYPAQSFDLAVGFGVLHHVVKYSRSALQLTRVLKPGGRAIFHETLWDNPLINFVRRWTTADDDAGDAHLTETSIRQFGNLCTHTEIHKRHIIYMLKRLAKMSERDLTQPLACRPLWRKVKRIDQGLTRLGLSRFCGEAIVVYTK